MYLANTVTSRELTSVLFSSCLYRCSSDNKNAKFNTSKAFEAEMCFIHTDHFVEIKMKLDIHSLVKLRDLLISLYANKVL